MKIKKLFIIIILGFLSTIAGPIAWAQFKLMPLDRSETLPSKNRSSRFRVQQDTTVISLPFWDDFSTSFGLPDTALWVNSENVIINGTMGIDPPSIMVATFDGFDLFGNPYDPFASGAGPTDKLTSRKIRMDKVAQIQRSTVYLSFFWQIEGRGELPDAVDFLRIQFKDQDGNWVTKKVLKGGGTPSNDTFQQELIRVDSIKYFHNTFQFRFQAFGNQTGSFDTWNIDYVYLNKNRSPTDINYFDRTITSLPSSIFKPYTIIPINQFITDPSKFLGTASAYIFNLDASQERQPISFSTFVIDRSTGNVVDQMDNFNNLTFTTDGNETNASLNGQEKRMIRSANVDVAKITQLVESVIATSPDDSAFVFLETRFILHSSDGNLIDSIFINNQGQQDTLFFEDIDLKVNDTISSQVSIGDCYAYDDGSAEFAVGLNQPGGKIAYQFILDEPDVITHLDISFPKIASNRSRSIRIFILKHLTSDPEDILYLDNQTISSPEPSDIDSLNHFERYRISPTLVSDTIYIGFEQLSTNRLGIGFDKNTNTFDKVYFNVSGSWEQDEGLEGSLMFRPRFGPKIITATQPLLKVDPSPITVFPNPSSGIVYIKGRFDGLKILDLSGRKLQFSIGQSEIATLNLSHFQNGIYLVYIYRDNEVQVQKLLINR